MLKISKISKNEGLMQQPISFQTLRLYQKMMLKLFPIDLDALKDIGSK